MYADRPASNQRPAPEDLYDDDHSFPNRQHDHYHYWKSHLPMYLSRLLVRVVLSSTSSQCASVYALYRAVLPQVIASKSIPVCMTRRKYKLYFY